MALSDRYPRLTASALYALVTLVTFRAVLAGQWLINEMSDQRTGYAFREFASAHFKATGAIPQWYGYLFGGMPYLANTAHGDTFFPTVLLRLAFPVDVGMSMGFVVFTFLAGYFAFLYARGLGLNWGASLVAGSAYMLTGQLISLVSPGHDGKLFVSALLPLAMLFLHRAVIRDAWKEYLYLGIVVGGALLSPHVQMTYYLLMACGFYWAYLAFFHEERSGAPWAKSLVLFAGALAVGFAVAAIQLVPFFEYLPYSPRGDGGESKGWEFATSYALPPSEIFALLWPQFAGVREHYWGSNPLKLHSSYLGAASLVLATLSLRLVTHRRLVWFFVFLIAYATLFALGGATPFYRIPYTILPGIAKTRAPDMIFYLASLAVAILAGFGTQALLAPRDDKSAAREPSIRPSLIWAGLFALGAVLAVTGGFKGLMTALADPQRMEGVDLNYGRFTSDTLRVLLFGGAAAALTIAAMRRRIGGTGAAIGLAAVITGDLFTAAQPFVLSSPPASVTFAADAVVKTLQQDSSHFRILPLAGYGDNYLMSHRLRSSLGYNGQELQRYDELLGGKNIWQNATNPNVWKISGVKYVVLGQAVTVPELEAIGGEMQTYNGQKVFLYRYRDATPFAYLVDEAMKVPNDQIIGTLLDGRFDPRRLLLVPSDAPAGSTTVSALPQPVANPVRVQEPAAGHFVLTLGQPAAKDQYVYLAENWYPAWKATVDGVSVPVLRAQHTMMAVPVKAGAKVVELQYEEAHYAIGKGITLVTLALILGLALAGPLMSRREAAVSG